MSLLHALCKKGLSNSPIRHHAFRTEEIFVSLNSKATVSAAAVEALLSSEAQEESAVWISYLQINVGADISSDWEAWKHFGSNTTLKDLVFTDYGTDDFNLHPDVFSYIGKGLSTNSHLLSIRVQFLIPLESGISAVAQGLASNTTLQTFQLTGVDLSEEQSEFCRNVFSSRSLRHVEFALTPLSDSGAVAIGRALPSNTCLESLELTCNSLSGDSYVSIVRGLAANSTIRTVSLGSNDMSEKAAEAVEQMLITNSTIKDLSLDRSRLRDACVLAIASGLKKNTSLESLSLRYNNITSAGGEALGPALKGTILRTLNLGYNQLGNHGIISILNGLRGPHQLASLYLSHNNANFEGKFISKFFTALDVRGGFSAPSDILSLHGNIIASNAREIMYERYCDKDVVKI